MYFIPSKTSCILKVLLQDEAGQWLGLSNFKSLFFLSLFSAHNAAKLGESIFMLNFSSSLFFTQLIRPCRSSSRYPSENPLPFTPQNLAFKTISGSTKCIYDHKFLGKPWLLCGHTVNLPQKYYLQSKYHYLNLFYVFLHLFISYLFL